MSDSKGPVSRNITLMQQTQAAGKLGFWLSLANVILIPIVYLLDPYDEYTIFYILFDISLMLPILFSSLYLRTDALDNIIKTKSRMQFLFYYTIFWFIIVMIGEGFPWLFLILLNEIYKAIKLFNTSFELKPIIK